VTFTATVTPTTATGTVTFKDNGTAIGTGTLSSGTATYSTWTLAVASHPITAAYGGDTNDTASTSSTLTQTVSSATSSTSVASSLNPSNYRRLVTFTATVEVGGNGPAPTGTVTFYNGSTAIGTVTLSGSTASLTPALLPMGSFSITASYSGNSDYTGSTSPVLTQTVNAPSTGLPPNCPP
jgi:hypothetical protein